MERYGKVTESLKQSTKEEFTEDYDLSLTISRYFGRIEYTVQLANDAKIMWKSDQIIYQEFF